jgi:hypothetical protein
MVFSIIFTFLKLSAVIIYLNEYLSKTFPEKYKSILIKVSYNFIYLYSKAQIMYNKLLNNTYIKCLIKNSTPVAINNNSVCQITTVESVIKCNHYLDMSFKHEKNCLYIFSDNENAVKNKHVNKIVLNSPHFVTPDYEVSNVKFLLIKITLGDKNYIIDLKTNEYNYYIVNNKFDKRFFIYFLTNYNICHCDDIPKLSDKMNINIMDHNVQFIDFEVTDDKYIIINKDNYIY